MEREASCACGQLSIKVSGDPKIVATCSCTQCQKRTGSVFGVSSYFQNEQVLEVCGDSTKCSRTAESGLSLESNFCPKCGSTVFWNAEFLKDHTGIAVGCFADTNFPEPRAAVWTGTKHDWVSFPENWASSSTQVL